MLLAFVLLKLHLVRPDLAPYPFRPEIYCSWEHAPHFTIDVVLG